MPIFHMISIELLSLEASHKIERLLAHYLYSHVPFYVLHFSKNRDKSDDKIDAAPQPQHTTEPPTVADEASDDSEDTAQKP